MYAALLVAAVVFLQFVLPGSRGGGRGTPMAIVFQGIVFGSVASLVAVGVVVIYRTLRIINFAQAALGAAGARLCYEFVQFTPVPFWLAAIIAVIVGFGVGAMFDLIFGRRFFNAPRVVLTVVTIAAIPFLGGYIADLMPRLPIFPNLQERTAAERFGALPVRDLLPFRGWKFRVGEFPTDFGFSEVFALELALLTVIAVVVFFRYTRTGVAVRALAENADRASLLGIGVGNVSTIVWGLAGGISAIGGLLLGALTVPAAAGGGGAVTGGVTDITSVAIVLLLPLAGAVLGQMERIWVAVIATIALNVLAAAFVFSYPDRESLVLVGYFLVIGIGLVVQRNRLARSEETSGITWDAVKELRPIPKELAGVSTVRWGRLGLIAVGLLTLVVFPFVAATRFVDLGSAIAIQTIVGVSLVVLTGWAGQISLGQVGFAAIGGAVAGALTAKVGLPFWLAVPMAAIITGAVAGLIGLPALRLKGLFLAVTTLAFAFAVRAFLFDERYFKWLLPGRTDSIDRPSLFFLNFEDTRSMYFLSVFSLVLAIVIVTNLRRSRFGRLLIAMRENEANVQSFGVSATRLKLGAFVAAGMLAGFSGAVFVHQQRGLSSALLRWPAQPRHLRVHRARRDQFGGRSATGCWLRRAAALLPPEQRLPSGHPAGLPAGRRHAARPVPRPRRPRRAPGGCPQRGTPHHRPAPPDHRPESVCRLRPGGAGHAADPTR